MVQVLRQTVQRQPHKIHSHSFVTMIPLPLSLQITQRKTTKKKANEETKKHRIQKILILPKNLVDNIIKNKTLNCHVSR